MDGDDDVLNERQTSLAIHVGIPRMRELIADRRFPQGFYLEGKRGKCWLRKDIRAYIHLQSRLKPNGQDEENDE